MAKTIQDVAQAAAKEFIPLYDELTTSDLQSLVRLTVADHLRGAEASAAENLALEMIYEFVRMEGENNVR